MRTPYYDIIDDLVRDRDQVVTPGQREDALRQAVLRYSEHRPLGLVADVASTGGRRLDLPDDWQHGRSQLLALEYPADSELPSLIEPGTYYVYQGPSVAQVQLPFTLQSGELVRVRYTRDHTLSDDVDTLPESDRRAVAGLAASELCGQIARHYAHEADSTIGADAVERKSKSDQYSKFSRDLRAEYFAYVGATDRRSQPAGVVVSPARPQEKTRLFGRRR